MQNVLAVVEQRVFESMNEALLKEFTVEEVGAVIGVKYCIFNPP
jgi:hypothetical protein